MTIANLTPEQQNRLREIVRSIEALEIEKADIGNEQKSILDNAKGEGLSPKAIKEVIKRRKMNSKTLEEWDHTVAVYEEVVDNA